MRIGKGVTYSSPLGGTISIESDTTNPTQTGVNGDWVYWNDLHIRSSDDLSIDLSGGHQVKSTEKHIAGNTIISFGVDSGHKYPKFDVMVVGLKPDSWYEVHINGEMVQYVDGYTNGKSDKNGVLTFYDVEI